MILSVIIISVVFFTGCTPKCITTIQYQTGYVDTQEVEEYRTFLKYELVGTPSAEGILKGLNYVRIGKVSVKNTDLESGEFVVSQTISKFKGKLTNKTTRIIHAGETLIFEAEFDVDLGEKIDHNYSITSESIVKTRIKTVKKPVTIAYNQTTCP